MSSFALGPFAAALLIVFIPLAIGWFGFRKRKFIFAGGALGASLLIAFFIFDGASKEGLGALAVVGAIAIGAAIVLLGGGFEIINGILKAKAPRWRLLRISLQLIFLLGVASYLISVFVAN